MTIGELLALGYTAVRELPSGEIAGVSKMLYTTALCIGLNESGYRTRYCYEHIAEAERALESWDGKGDPPGPWIKEKPSERLGPGATGQHKDPP